MKLNYEEKKILKELLKFDIQRINELVISNNLDDKLIARLINDGDEELNQLVIRKNMNKQLLKKINSTSTPGASLKQIKTLNKTALLKEEKSKNKILNAINILQMYNNRISVSSVAKESGISYNTANKYRDIIEQREKARVK